MLTIDHQTLESISFADLLYSFELKEVSKVVSLLIQLNTSLRTYESVFIKTMKKLTSDTAFNTTVILSNDYLNTVI